VSSSITPSTSIMNATTMTIMLAMATCPHRRKLGGSGEHQQRHQPDVDWSQQGLAGQHPQRQA
jgi:hypothetical protein